ncbi:MAG: hypothetical protein CMJ77_22180 [Planctomycetaceae bacterium]|nr:hypothetical protein [Planctomycetaceae bacterium]
MLIQKKCQFPRPERNCTQIGEIDILWIFSSGLAKPNCSLVVTDNFHNPCNRNPFGFILILDFDLIKTLFANLFVQISEVQIGRLIVEKSCRPIRSEWQR